MNAHELFPPSSAGTGDDGSLKGHGRAHWTEEMYLPLSPERLQLPTKLPPRRWGTALTIVTVLLGALALRAFNLQIVHGADYRERATSNRIAIKVVKASRGLVYDRNLVPLVKNVPRFSLIAQPNLLPTDLHERAALLDRVADLVALDDGAREKIAAADASGSPIVIAASVLPDQAYRFLALKNGFPEFSLSTTAIRSYPFDDSLAHVLGYIGRLNAADAQEHPDYSLDDYIGKTGLETEYENTLRGINGKNLYEVDAALHEQRLLQQVDAHIGTSLVLGIDEGLQKHLSNTLREALVDTHSPGGAAVAIDPRDGSILALVSEPSFSASDFQSGISTAAYQALAEDPRKPLFNRVVAGQYPSGSTIKPFVALAALESGVITPSFSVNSTGGIHIGQYFYPDWKPGGHGVTDVRHAIANSVNTFFYIVGGGDNDRFSGLGATRLQQYLEKYGFSKKTGIDLPGEQDGFVPSPRWRKEIKGEEWYLGDTYHFAIGQGDLLVTPLQLASSVAALANGGTLYRPRLVTATYNEDTRIKTDIPPHIETTNLAGAHNIRVVREGMRLTVTDGTARQLQTLPVAAAAKTGTAQFGSGEKTHALFETFAPYDQPTIALVVLVEEGGQGSSVGQQIAKDVLGWYFSR